MPGGSPSGPSPPADEARRVRDEWEALASGEAGTMAGLAAVSAPVRPLTGNSRAFRVLVRNAMFRRVQLAAQDDPDALAGLEADDADLILTGDDWDAALDDYYDEHDGIGTGSAARSPSLFVVEDDRTRRWQVTQIIDDPACNHDWQIRAEVNLDASDELGELVLRVVGFERVD